MTISNHLGAYLDCIKLLDQATEDTKGVRVQVPDDGSAIHFRMRLHRARTLNREYNAKVYAEDHPMHNASVYDKLIVRIREIEGITWVYIEQQGINLGRVEALSEVEEPQLAPPESLEALEAQPEPLQITHQPSTPLTRRV